MDANDFYQDSQRKRAERFRDDWDFKRVFYQKIDEMLFFELLEDFQPTIEFLVCFSERIDGNKVYQPLKNFYLCDLEYFLYGLLHWNSIKDLLLYRGSIKQTDLISQLNLDKDKASYFLYTLGNIGVLRKEKKGRCNVYSFVTERINKNKLKDGWNLFDASRRVPIE